MNTKQEIINGLVQFLGLRSKPIAVKMVCSEEEIPAEAIRPMRDLGHHLSLCQVFSKCRRQGQSKNIQIPFAHKKSPLC